MLTFFAAGDRGEAGVADARLRFLEAGAGAAPPVSSSLSWPC